MNPVQTLIQLEPVFLEAGRLAVDMQQNAKSFNKLETGDPISDIVTEADLAVQELLLRAIAKTDLVSCRLLAEEDTPGARLFSGAGEYYLCIDPIDGTKTYSEGKQDFAVIITLHDGKQFLYAFVDYPAWNWTHRITPNGYETFGNPPDIPLPREAERTIVYWRGDPESTVPSDVVQKLRERNIHFKPIRELSDEYGTICTFALNKVAGVYHENSNVYDGVTEMCIAKARRNKIYSGSTHGEFDLSDIQKREKGFYYPGYYLVLNDIFSANGELGMPEHVSISG